MSVDERRCLISHKFNANVNLRVAFMTQRHFSLRGFINPLDQGSLRRRTAMDVQLRNRTHLGIQKGVSEEELLAL